MPASVSTGQWARIVLRAHWPVDTLAGIALGLLLASLATMLSSRR